MASDATFVAFVREQLAGAGAISARKMFGEYAIYCNQKVVALVCDNQLFVKPTAAATVLLGQPRLAPPYPGAKPYFLIDDLDDADSLARLIAVTVRELPTAKPKAAGRANAKKKRRR